MDDAETYREKARACRRLNRRQSRDRRRYIRALADGFDRIAAAKGARAKRPVVAPGRRGRGRAGAGVAWRALVGIALGLMIGLMVSE